MKPKQDSPSRRRLLATGAAAIGSTAVAAPMAMANAPSTKVDALWAEFASLGKMIADADAKIDAATAALPAWAAPGPKLISADGSFSGAIVGWPLDITVAPSQGRIVSRVARVSLHDLRSLFELDREIGFSDDAKKTYVHKLRKLARLRMEQKAEKKKVGLPELKAQRNALVDRRWDTALAILSTDETSANAVAAKIIIGALFNSDNVTGTDVVTADLGDMTSALTALQPSLGGQIAVDVAELLKWGDDADAA